MGFEFAARTSRLVLLGPAVAGLADSSPMIQPAHVGGYYLLGNLCQLSWQPRNVSCIRFFRKLALVLAIALSPHLGLAEENKAPLPRFASLDSGEINLRAGPGTDYPILWVYRRKGLPVEIVQEFENWRRIRDRDGTLGWVQRNLLSGRRMAQIVGETREIRARPEPDSRPIANLEAGVIAGLRECGIGPWCRIEIQDFSGWITRDALWGVRDGEIVEDD